MNDNFKLDIAYIAGLFDSRGSIYYKQIIEKRKTKKPTNSLENKNGNVYTG